MIELPESDGNFAALFDKQLRQKLAALITMCCWCWKTSGWRNRYIIR